MPPELPFPWRIGEHIAVIGDTGSGKTFLMSKLADLRSYIIVFRTKPDDITFRNMRHAKQAAAIEDVHYSRILLTPQYEYHLREGYAVLEKVWRHGGWTMMIDEEWYVERLGLREMVERLLTQGRSMGISVVIGTQRPAMISRFIISQATHVFVFRTEGRDTKTVAEATSPRMRDAIDSLTGHDFAYFHRPTRTIVKGNAKKLSALIRGVGSDRAEAPVELAQGAT